MIKAPVQMSKFPFSPMVPIAYICLIAISSDKSNIFVPSGMIQRTLDKKYPDMLH